MARKRRLRPSIPRAQERYYRRGQFYSERRLQRLEHILQYGDSPTGRLWTQEEGIRVQFAYVKDLSQQNPFYLERLYIHLFSVFFH